MTEEEYEKLVREYYDLVYRKMVNEMRGNIEVAEDLTQETFYKAYRYRHQFKGDSKPSSWLYRIAVNELGMYFRKNKSGNREYIDARPLDSIEEGEFKDMSYQMHDPIDKKQFDKNLEPVEIQIIKMKFQGYSTNDIALIMGRSVPAIKSRIFRIRLKVKSKKKFTKRQDVPKLPERIPREKYTPSVRPKVYKFTPGIKPKVIQKPRRFPNRPINWDDYFSKKAVNE